MVQRPEHVRPREGPDFDEGRGKRVSVEARADDQVAPAFGRGAARLTCLDILAAAGERLAAKGFDWGDAHRAGHGPSHGRRGEGR